MSYLWSRTLLVLVSSARIRSASFRTFTALNVMSSRFPTGVGTMYRIPAIAPALAEFSPYGHHEPVDGIGIEVPFREMLFDVCHRLLEA